MGIAGEIAQDFLRAAEGVLAVDHPLFVVQRPQIRGERLRIGKPGMLAEELQLTGLMSGAELVQEQSAEQFREHGHRQEEARPACDPAPSIERQARDILPKNIRLKLLFSIHTTLALENASSRSDESSTEVACIL